METRESVDHDWFISKADLVDEIYSYEPYLPVGRDLRSLFSRPSKQPIQHPLSTNLRQQFTQYFNPPQPEPKYTKFSVHDKKDNFAQIHYLPPQLQQQPLRVGPTYEHLKLTTPPPSPLPNLNNHNQTPPPQLVPPPPHPPTPPPRVGYPDATAEDKQTIVWPEDQKLMMSGDASLFINLEMREK